MKVVHNDIEITYNEDANTWEFTLRGRERTAPSLAKAKEWIEKPVLNKVGFEPVEAFRVNTWQGARACRITSIARPSRYSGPQVWVVYEDGVREKVHPNGLILNNETNRAQLSEIEKMEREVEQLHNKIEAIKKGFEWFVIPRPTDEE